MDREKWIIIGQIREARLRWRRDKKDERLRRRVVELVEYLQNWNKYRLNDVLGIDTAIHILKWK